MSYKSMTYGMTKMQHKVAHSTQSWVVVTYGLFVC